MPLVTANYAGQQNGNLTMMCVQVRKKLIFTTIKLSIKMVSLNAPFLLLSLMVVLPF